VVIYISIVQIILSVALIALVLVQMRNAGLGGVFGGGDGGVQHTRRGIDRLLFNITIGVSVAFFVVSLLNVLYGNSGA
jgi:preprotein translocase subunit SecG